MENVIKEKWIKATLGVMAFAHTTIDARKILKEYGEELGWDFKEDKKGVIDEDGKKLYHMWIEPKGGEISPEEFGEEIQRIYGFTETLGGGIKENRNEEGEIVFDIKFAFTNDLMRIGKKENVEMTLKYAGLLDIIYPLTKRIQLEKADKDLALTIFRDTFQENFDEMENLRPTLTEWLFKTDIYNYKKKLLERIKNWFGVI